MLSQRAPRTSFFLFSNLVWQESDPKRIIKKITIFNHELGHPAAMVGGARIKPFKPRLHRSQGERVEHCGPLSFLASIFWEQGRQ